MPESSVQRWDELPLEQVTAMASRKVIAGTEQTIVQLYLKCGTHVPLHRHAGEQVVYVLQGALRCVVAGREQVVREGGVLRVPAGIAHQAEALEDTFQLVIVATEGQ